jgi:hypothetical protein
MYSIKTEVCGNPDYGQNTNRPPYGVRVKTIKAKTYAELLDKVREWQSDNDIGGGNWMNPALMRDSEIVGYMSYNGKIWSDQSITPSTMQIHIRELSNA